MQANFHTNVQLDDFLTETFEVWKTLIKNPLVYDFVDMDSRRRENRKIDFEIVI